MPIELNREARAQAVASIERYFSEELDQRIGNIGAGASRELLEEIGPLVYNQAVGQVQERLLQRIQELDIEFNEDAFQYWRRRSALSPARSGSPAAIRSGRSQVQHHRPHAAIQHQRLTASIDGEFVVFLIGMRVNRPLLVQVVPGGPR